MWTRGMTEGDIDAMLDASDDPLLEVSARIWHEAERIGTGNGRVEWDHLSDDEKRGARARAAKVMAGEVKWSETGPGDRAIWVGRESASGRAGRRAMAALHREALRLGRQCRWTQCLPWRAYDTLSLEPHKQIHHYTRLFGNYNIGNYFLTNLQIPGQVAFGDNCFFIDEAYVTYRYDGAHSDELRRVIDSAVVSVIIGEQFAAPHLHAGDICVGFHTWSERHGIGKLVRPRQNLSVRIDFYGDTRPVIHPIDIVVHLDGAVTRDLV